MMSELSGYDYELPPHLIAQAPVRSRSDARLLVVDRARKYFDDAHNPSEIWAFKSLGE